MGMSQYLRTGRFLKLDAFRAGFTKCIAHVDTLGTYGPELRFADGDRLTLNDTNLRALIAAYGDEWQDWIGHTVKGAEGVAPVKNKQTGETEQKPVGLLTAVTKPGEQKAMPKVARPKPQDFGADDSENPGDFGSI